MFVLMIILVFLVIVAGTWFMGLWSNILTLINVILAATIASGFFEAVATAFDNSIDPETGDRFIGRLAPHTYLLDFLSLWGLFFVSFGLLRMSTDIASKYKMKFNIWVEMVGRSVFSILIAWVFICFAVFTLHTAPLPVNAFGGKFQPTPQARNFLGIGPDRLWMAYLSSRSRGALSRSAFRPSALHPDDVDKNIQPFDSKGEFIYRYHDRRETFSEAETTLVNRAW